MYMFHKTIKPVVFVSRSLPGIDRLFLALLCSAYDEDEIDGDKRSVLRQRIKEGNEKNKHKKIYKHILYARIHHAWKDQTGLGNREKGQKCVQSMVETSLEHRHQPNYSCVWWLMF